MSSRSLDLDLNKPLTTGPSTVVEKQVKTNGKLIQPLRLHYDTTRKLFSSKPIAQNRVLAAAEKAGRVALAIFVVAIAETLRNLAFGLIDAPIALINGIHSLVAKKEKEQSVEVEMTPVVTPTDAEVTAMEAQPVAPTETAAPAKPVNSSILQIMKDNPGKTALAIASMIATGAAVYYYAPAIASTISTWMNGASSASNFSSFSQFSNFSNFGSNVGSNFAGSNFVI